MQLRFSSALPFGFSFQTVPYMRSSLHLRNARKGSFGSRGIIPASNRNGSRNTSIPSLSPELTIHRRSPFLRFIEAIKDPKTLLFFFHAWSQEMANGLTNQYSLIINSFGFTVLQTTLLGCVTGATALVSQCSSLDIGQN